MNIDRPLGEALPDLPRGKPRPGEIRGDKARESERAGLQEITSQSKYATNNRRGQLRLPFFDFLNVLEKFDVPLDDAWPREVTPPPELRGCGTSHPGDGGRRALMSDGDGLTFLRRERHFAGRAVRVSRQQSALSFRSGHFGLAYAFCDAVGNFRFIDLAERGYGDFLLFAVDRDGFQRGIGRESGGDRSNDAVRFGFRWRWFAGNHRYHPPTIRRFEDGSTGS